MSSKENKESLWVKLYIVMLFFCGIAIWFCVQPIKKQEVSVDIFIEKRIGETLIKRGATQDDILKQYVRERKVVGSNWNEFYKVIKLKPNQKMHFFQEDFREIARDMKVGLSKLDNVDGSTTYKFYSPDRTYSNITVVPVKSLKNGYEK